MNIVNRIEVHGRTRPEAPALIGRGLRMNFAQVGAAMRRVAARLAKEGIAPGDVVGVDIREAPALQLLLLLGLARLGAISVKGRFKTRTVITSDARDDGAGTRCIAARGWLADRGPESEQPAFAGGDRPWHVTVTSGTTGEAKAVARTHAEFVRILEQRQSLVELGADSRFLSRMTLHSGPALKRVLYQLHAGGAVLFPRPALRDTLEDIDEHRATHGYLSPIMLTRWVEAAAARRAPFATLVELNIGGGRVNAALEQAAAERITPNLSFTYGTTETSTVAVADRELRRRYPGCTGRVVPWLEAQAVDEHDRPLPAGESGVLRYRGEGVAQGYFDGGPGGSFRAGWCYPGDIGRITAERIIYLEDRVDDRINIGGPKFSARAIEEALCAHPDVLEAAVLGVPSAAGGTAVVAAVVARGARFDAKALHQLCTSRQVAPSSLRVVRVDELPRSELGKVIKPELRQRLAGST